MNYTLYGLMNNTFTHCYKKTLFIVKFQNYHIPFSGLVSSPGPRSFLKTYQT